MQQQARLALEKAVALLQPRRELMDELVSLLIEQETIEGPAFTAVVERFEQQRSGVPATAAAV